MFIEVMYMHRDQGQVHLILMVIQTASSSSSSYPKIWQILVHSSSPSLKISTSKSLHFFRFQFLISILPISSYHACYTFHFHFHSSFYFFHVFQVRDLCALGCCSKFWRQLCFSDSIWHSLVTNRWPLLHSSLSPYIKVGYPWFFLSFLDSPNFLFYQSLLLYFNLDSGWSSKL